MSRRSDGGCESSGEKSVEPDHCCMDVPNCIRHSYNAVLPSHVHTNIANQPFSFVIPDKMTRKEEEKQRQYGLDTAVKCVGFVSCLIPRSENLLGHVKQSILYGSALFHQSLLTIIEVRNALHLLSGCLCADNHTILHERTQRKE